MSFCFGRRVRTLLTGVAGCFALGALVPLLSVRAAAPASPSVGDADAQAVIHQMVAAHKGLKSYSSSVKLTIQQGLNSQSIDSKIAYAKPNKVMVFVKDPVQGGTRTYVSDGAFLIHSATSEKNTYHKIAAAPNQDNIYKALHDSKACASPAFALLAADDDAEPQLLNDARSLKKQKDGKIDGVPVEVVALTFKSSPQVITFSVGKTDHLLRRFSFVVKENGVENSFTEEYKDVTANPVVPETTFSYTPKKDAKVIAD